MSVITPRTVFMHVPKTGGSWVTEAVLAAVPRAYRLRQNHYPPERFLGLRQGRRTFTVVRDPFAWYVSRWAGNNHRHLLNLKRAIPSVKPAPFLQWISPGYYTQQLLYYLGQSFSQCETFLRHEDLANELVRMLRESGEVFDESVIRGTAPFNVSSDEFKAQAEYDLGTRAAIIEADALVFKTFGYEESR